MKRTFWEIQSREVSCGEGLQHHNRCGGLANQSRTLDGELCIRRRNFWQSTLVVVPAKAGTQAPQRAGAKVVSHGPKMPGRGVWVPASAGTTRGECRCPTL